MKNIRLTALLALLLLLGVSGCAGLNEGRYGEVPGSGSEISGIFSEGGYYNSPASVAGNGDPATLYINESGRIVFKRDGKILFLDEDVKAKGNGRRPLLYKEGNHFYAIWWAKTKPEGDKHLYFKPSYNGGETFEATRIINTGNGVLNFSFASDGSGNMGFVYNDERNAPYEIYINLSHDYGRTWFERDTRLDNIGHEDEKKNARKKSVQLPKGNFALEPNIAVDGQTVVTTWKEQRVDEGSGKPLHYLKAKVSGDGGRNWSEEMVVRAGSNQVFTAVNLLLFEGIYYIFGHENSTGIAGFMSRDRGRTWESIAVIKGTEATVNSQLKVIQGREGYLYAVYTSEEGERKAQIHFAGFSTHDHKWSNPVRVDRKGLDLTKSINPDIALLKNGVIVVAWEDYRNIRPNIYLNVSSDKGKSWLDMSIAVEEPGRFNSTASFLHAKDDSLYLFFQRFRTDSKKELDYLYRKYDTKDGDWVKKITYPAVSDAEKDRVLRERVNTFWQLRVDGRFAELYDYYDPYYRAMTDKDKFISTQGSIIYHKAALSDAEIKGNFANVKLDMTFEVPEKMLMGKKFSIPRKDSTLNEDWIWLYDNWYKLYKKPVGGQSLLEQ